MSGRPQPRPQKAKKDKRVLDSLHLERGECCLSNNDCTIRIELHHVLSRAQGGDDERGDIVRLCSYHHEKITRNDVEARVELGAYILIYRQDVIAYICSKLGPVSGDDWLRRRLFIGT